MSEHRAKRCRLSAEEVLLEIDEEEVNEAQDEPMTQGSDDEFDDITCGEKERDEYGGVEEPVLCSIPPTPTPHSASPTTSPAASRCTHTTSLPSSDWSSTLSPIDIAPFTQPVGPTVEIPPSPLAVFNLFFTDELCSTIVTETNRYAEQVLGDKYNEWEKVTTEELRAYFGFMILMGLYPRPSLGGVIHL